MSFSRDVSVMHDTLVDNQVDEYRKVGLLEGMIDQSR